MVEESIVFRPDIPDRDIQREVREVDRQLNDAGTINPEIGDVQGDLSMGGGGGGLRGSGPGSPLRSMSGGIEDLVPMADYRNRLLEDILDGVQSGGGDGGGGFLGRITRLLKGGLGGLLGGGAIALAGIIASKLTEVDLGSLIGDALPDLAPGDIIDPVEVGVSDLLADAFPIGIGALLGSGFPLKIGDIIADAVTDGEPSPEGQPSPSPAPGFTAPPQFQDFDATTPSESTAPGVGNSLVAAAYAEQESGTSTTPFQRGVAANPGKTLAALGLIGGGAAFTAFSGGAGGGIGGPAAAKGAGILGLLAAGTGAAAAGGGNQTPNVTVNENFTIDASSLSEVDRRISESQERARERALRDFERSVSGGGPR